MFLNYCFLFLFEFNTVVQMFWNQGCKNHSSQSLLKIWIDWLKKLKLHNGSIVVNSQVYLNVVWLPFVSPQWLMLLALIHWLWPTIWLFYSSAINICNFFLPPVTFFNHFELCVFSFFLECLFQCFCFVRKFSVIE